MKYYKIVTARAHVGMKKLFPITFYFSANNICEALEKVKKMPGTKKSRFPYSCTEIEKSEYNKNIKVSAYWR